MKKQAIRLAIAHVAVVTSFVLAVLIVLDVINPRMGFMRRGICLAVAVSSVLSSIVLGVCEIVRSSRGDRSFRK